MLSLLRIELIAPLRRPTNDPEGFSKTFQEVVDQVNEAGCEVKLAGLNLGNVDDTTSTPLDRLVGEGLSPELLNNTIDDMDSVSLVDNATMVSGFTAATSTKSILCRTQTCMKCGKSPEFFPEGGGHQTAENQHNRCPTNKHFSLKGPCPVCGAWCSRRCTYGEGMPTV